MDCRNHPAKTAVNTCGHCGDWLCEVCTADVGGRVYCASCLQKHWIGHDAPPKAPPVYRPPLHESRKRVSGGLLLFFSFFPPGINYMYVGLMKRGLFFLSAFSLSIYLAATIDGLIFGGLILPIMWITCIFDAFRIRGRINDGENVPDSVDDVLGFVKKYRGIIALLFVIILGLNLLGSLNRAFFSFPHYYSIAHIFNRKLLPVLVFFGGLYLIVSSGKRVKSTTIVDHRESSNKNTDHS